MTPCHTLMSPRPAPGAHWILPVTQVPALISSANGRFWLLVSSVLPASCPHCFLLPCCLHPFGLLVHCWCQCLWMLLCYPMFFPLVASPSFRPRIFLRHNGADPPSRLPVSPWLLWTSRLSPNPQAYLVKPFVPLATLVMSLNYQAPLSEAIV